MGFSFEQLLANRAWNRQRLNASATSKSKRQVAGMWWGHLLRPQWMHNVFEHDSWAQRRRRRQRTDPSEASRWCTCFCNQRRPHLPGDSSSVIPWMVRVNSVNMRTLASSSHCRCCHTCGLLLLLRCCCCSRCCSCRSRVVCIAASSVCLFSLSLGLSLSSICWSKLMYYSIYTQLSAAI